MRSVALLALATATLQTACFAQQRFPVTVSISTSTPTVAIGDEIRINVAIVNSSDQPVQLLKSPDGDAEAISRVEVYDPQGNKLPWTSKRQRWLGIKTVAVDPGKSSDGFLNLNKLFDLSKPGTYTVIVHHELLQPDASQSEAKRLFVPSNALKITVTD